MSLPLFFGIFSKDTESNANFAALGNTFGDDAGQILWGNHIPAKMLVIDDRNLPVESDDWSMLSDTEAEIILFDFERPRNEACAGFLQTITELPMRQIIPPAYADCNPKADVIVFSKICNHWGSFCRKQQALYPNRWCLELVPWNQTISGQRTSTAKTYQNHNALCITAKDGENRFFYDTAATLRQKLDIAEQNGCQLAVGLYDELRSFFPAV